MRPLATLYADSIYPIISLVVNGFGIGFLNKKDDGVGETEGREEKAKAIEYSVFFEQWQWLYQSGLSEKC